MIKITKSTKSNKNIWNSGICGWCTGCFKISTNRSPRWINLAVSGSISEPNLIKSNISLYWANSNFKFPARLFIAGNWAAVPTRLTDKPTLTAGLIPVQINQHLKKFDHLLLK